MSDRPVPFDRLELCDQCGATGAYDFMGDNLCDGCAATALNKPDALLRARSALAWASVWLSHHAMDSVRNGVTLRDEIASVLNAGGKP